jgi:hypothetical protein
MRLLYDAEVDVLNVIFDERLHRAEQAAYLKLDPQTGYGHLPSQPMLEMFPLAA